MENKCPYCQEVLDKEDAFYLFHWSKDSEADDDESYMELKEFLKNHIDISDRRKKERHEKVWKYYGYDKIEDLPFSSYDMILRKEEVRQLINFLEHPEAIRVEKHPSNLQLPQLIERNINEELLRKNTESYADIRMDSMTDTVPSEGRQYFWREINADEEFDFQIDISYGIEEHVIVRVRRVCPNCYNLIPDDLYSYDIIKVYLMASPSSGKTSMLYSIFLNQDTFNRHNNRYMTWESIQDISIDPFFRNFWEQAKEYKRNPLKIDPTKVRFIPPLLLKVRYLESSEEKTVVLAVYDNGGELFLDNNNRIAEEDAEIYNQKIRGMDAVLCLISMDDSYRDDNRYELSMSQDKIEKVLQNSRILSLKEQRMIEEDPVEQEVTIWQILEELSGSKTIAGQSSRDILKILEYRLGGEKNMREIIQDKYFGLVVSKIDSLSQSSIFQDEERPLFYEDIETFFSDEEKYRKSERDRKMMQLLEEHQLVDYELTRFRVCNYHFIAAFIETQKQFHPIRVEEPLIGIVRDFFRKG